MNPTDVGHSYDRIAHRWQDPTTSLSGVPQHEKAIQFVKTHGYALDVGCGCNGRFIGLLQKHGFHIEAVDVSEEMIVLAKQRNPEILFFHHDICSWTLPRTYNFITGWDSIWHVPLTAQKAVLGKLCDGLSLGGIFIFTMGGTDEPGDVQDAHMGVPMYTATLGIPETLATLALYGCTVRHLEYDQYPQLHVCVIVQKTKLC